MFNWTDSLHVVNMFCHITFLMQLLKILKDSVKLHLVFGVLDLMTLFFDLVANLSSFF